MDEIRIVKVLDDMPENEGQPDVQKGINEEPSESGDTKKLLFMIVIIIGVFAFSLGGFKVFDKITGASVSVAGEQVPIEDTYTYNDFEFIKADGLWWTYIQGQGRTIKVPLHFGPREVEHIPLTGNLLNEFYKGKEIYIAIDPNITNKYYTLAISELSMNIAKGIGRTPEGSCTENDEICDERTIVNCENTQGKPVIELRVEEVAAVTLKGTCILVTGQEYELVKATDRLLLDWYGVIE
jgi:hypothetical protein